MLTRRLRGSILHLLSGESGRVSVKEKLVLLNRGNIGIQESLRSCYTCSALLGRGIACFRTNGLQILNRLLHNSTEDDFLELSATREGIESLEKNLYDSTEEDDWAVLGSVEKGRLVIPKLMTEKPESFRIFNGKRKASSTSSSPAENNPSLKNIHRKTSNRKNASNSRYSTSITVLNVPSSITLSQLSLRMLGYGKISAASIRTKPDGFYCCDIKYMDVESRRRALADSPIKINKIKLLVQPLEVGSTVTIRISNLNSQIADSAVHATCMSYGPLEGLARVSEGIVDALFHVKDGSEADDIVEKLNSTTIDDCQLVAEQLQGIDSTPDVTPDPKFLKIN